MHDDLLERRLRSALRDEGDGLPLTITAAELERRMAMRGRRSGARLTLLLAAAVTIGAIGAGTILGGLSNRPTATPVANASATPRTAESNGTAILPSLDDMIASDPATVLVAQAYGPADSPGFPLLDLVKPSIPTVSLGELPGGGDYDVSVACLGSSPLEVALMPIDSSAAIDGPRFACDGAVHAESIHVVGGAANAFIGKLDGMSWRVVIRGDRRQPPLPTMPPALPALPDGVDELVRLEDATVETVAEPYAASSLQLRLVDAVPARTFYAARVWCEPGATLRLLFADRIEGVLTPAIETALACDGLVHDLSLPLPLPNGSPVMVAAAPSTHWSVVIGSTTPPVAVADDIPGWQSQDAAGPSLHFEATEISISDVAGERGGPLMVVLECAGPSQEIQLKADIKGILGDAFQTYPARCEPSGERTSWTFETPATGFIISHEAPAGTWTALTLLTPVASPGH